MIPAERTHCSAGVRAENAILADAELSGSLRTANSKAQQREIDSPLARQRPYAGEVIVE
jgi:hypothetical protein